VEKNSNPYGVKVGEVWVENDLRPPLRKIRIVGFLPSMGLNHNGFGYVEIENLATGKRSMARLDRFNGRQRGYSRVEKE
jgi:hypothetical protein